MSQRYVLIARRHCAAARRRRTLPACAALAVALMLGSAAFAWGGAHDREERPSIVAVEPPVADLVPDSVPPPPLPPAPPPTRPLGVFRVTAYCPCRQCCGKWALLPESERPPLRGPYCAADLGVLPRGTRVHIQGIGWRTVSDTGGDMVGRRIDLLMPSHRQARRFGRKWLKVEVPR